MLEQLPPHVLIVSAVFLLAGAVKGMTGMGLPTVAMGALGAVMPPVVAASLLIVPSFVTNVWQLFAGGYTSSTSARCNQTCRDDVRLSEEPNHHPSHREWCSCHDAAITGRAGF